MLEREARELNPGFISRMTRGRPWVTVKLAASLDGGTALPGGESRWITGEAARADVQRLRAQSSAVMTGSGTVLTDDPRLDVRLPGVLRQPLRVVLDSRLRTPPTARVLAPPGQALILCTEADAARASALRAAGAEVATVAGAQGGVDLEAALTAARVPRSQRAARRVRRRARRGAARRRPRRRVAALSRTDAARPRRAPARGPRSTGLDGRATRVLHRRAPGHRRRPAAAAAAPAGTGLMFTGIVKAIGRVDAIERQCRRATAGDRHRRARDRRLAARGQRRRGWRMPYGRGACGPALRGRAVGRDARAHYARRTRCRLRGQPRACAARPGRARRAPGHRSRRRRCARARVPRGGRRAQCDDRGAGSARALHRREGFGGARRRQPDGRARDRRGLRRSTSCRTRGR